MTSCRCLAWFALVGACAPPAAAPERPDLGAGTSSGGAGSESSAHGSTSAADDTGSDGSGLTSEGNSTGGPTPSTGATADADSTSTTDTTGDSAVVLLDLPGEAFIPTPNQPALEYHDLGEPGVAYARIELTLDVDIGSFRTDLPPDGVARWDHMLFGLFREGQPSSWQRYLSGASARVEARGPERLFHYARIEVAPGPPSYTAFKANYPWQENSTVQLHHWIDADDQQQGLELWVDDALALSIPGPIDYFTPALTTDGLYLSLAEPDADWGLHVSPHGWVFSDVLLVAWPAQ